MLKEIEGTHRVELACRIAVTQPINPNLDLLTFQVSTPVPKTMSLLAYPQVSGLYSFFSGERCFVPHL